MYWESRCMRGCNVRVHIAYLLTWETHCREDAVLSGTPRWPSESRACHLPERDLSMRARGRKEIDYNVREAFSAPLSSPLFAYSSQTRGSSRTSFSSSSSSSSSSSCICPSLLHSSLAILPFTLAFPLFWEILFQVQIFLELFIELCHQPCFQICL